MKITPQDIHNQEFKRSLRGYDLDEVDAFLQQVADDLETLIQENQGLKDRAKDLEGKLTEYRRKDEMLEKTLVTAQRMTEDMKDVARRESEVAAAHAKAEAQKIVAEAHKQLVRFSAQIDEMKRYRDAFIINFKAFLDSQYRFLADFARSGSAPGAGVPAPEMAPPGGGKAGAGGKSGAAGEKLEIEVVPEAEGEVDPLG
jgi:cell division initiation protein